jgi:hypothetical protein
MVLNEATIILCSWLNEEHIGNLTMYIVIFILDPVKHPYRKSETSRISRVMGSFLYARFRTVILLVR